MASSVSIRDFYWRYPNFTGIKSDYALKGINLDINDGEFFGITGPSGSGKTTLCYAITGLIPHQLKLPLHFEDNISGEISVLGKTVTKLERSGESIKLAGGGSMAPEVGLVMQDPESQFLSMSVMNEMSLGLQMMNIGKEEMKSRIMAALEMVGLGDLYRDAEKIHPSELSGGQKQRLVIASLLAMKPKILILDEPTSDLDPKGKMEVIETIAKLKETANMTIILVEHNPEVMMRFADRLAVLHEGSLVAVGKPSEIYSNKELTSKYNIYTPEVSELSEYFSIDENPKRKIPYTSFSIKRGAIKNEPPIISLDNVSFSYEDGTKALENISLKIEKGSLVALVGQNGSGKSTLSKLISGILPASSGRMEIAGINPNKKKERLKLPLHVSYVFQNPDHQIFTRRVTDEINYSLKNAGITGEEARTRIEEILKRVGLSEKANEDPVFLGRGQKRRLAVASSIVLKPEILIVDEPTTGQDYKMSMEIMEIIKHLNDEGVTTLIITHDMRLVAEYCRRVLVMSKGSIVFDGTPEALFMDENILKLSSLAEPQSVRLSKEMISSGILKEPLISAKEWLEFFNFLKSKTRIEFRSLEDVNVSAEKIAKEILKKGKPDEIIYIERGGMVLGSMLSEKLGEVPMQGVSASHYNEIGAVTKEVNIHGIDSLSIKAGSGYSLVVDELVDTGKTLKSIMEELGKSFPERRFITCTMLVKPRSVMKPEIFAEQVSDETWVVFDYERDEAFKEFEKANPSMLQELTKHFSEKRKDKYANICARADEVSSKISEHIETIIYENPGALIFARLLSDRLSVKNMLPFDKVKPLIKNEKIILAAKSNNIATKMASSLGIKNPKIASID